MKSLNYKNTLFKNDFKLFSEMFVNKKINKSWKSQRYQKEKNSNHIVISASFFLYDTEALSNVNYEKIQVQKAF